MHILQCFVQPAEHRLSISTTIMLECVCVRVPLHTCAHVIISLSLSCMTLFVNAHLSCMRFASMCSAPTCIPGVHSILHQHSFQCHIVWEVSCRPDTVAGTWQGTLALFPCIHSLVTSYLSWFCRAEVNSFLQFMRMTRAVVIDAPQDTTSTMMMMMTTDVD